MNSIKVNVIDGTLYYTKCNWHEVVSASGVTDEISIHGLQNKLILTIVIFFIETKTQVHS